MKILVLGAYGLIGSAIVRRLSSAGHAITGLGREVTRAQKQFPSLAWIKADIARLQTSDDWAKILSDTKPDVIINSAGALQNGLGDDLAALQSNAMQALYAAAAKAGVTHLIQISATRAQGNASTLFMRTKGQADAALAASALEWTILRPGLVIAAQAYGGTALLRATAALPFMQPVISGTGTIQTVSVEDVAGTVEAVIAGRIASRQIYDLVEDKTHSLADIIVAMRNWLGLSPARILHVPAWLVRPACLVADGLGWLGWRSPLRSTAIEELRAGISGNPSTLTRATGDALSSFTQTLEKLPSTIQERWFARLYFFKPVAILTLSAFWLITGVITLIDIDAAAAVLRERQVSAFWAYSAVVSGAFADILLGACILVRPWLRFATTGMIAVTLAYLIGGTMLAPDLWRDPLGPLLKAIPAMMLALATHLLADDR